MKPVQCLRRFLIGGLISACLWQATEASAQYFGPAFYGFRPGSGVGVGPGVAIGAIPRWSRHAPIYSPRYAPVYPPIGYRGSVAIAPVVPVLPLPPIDPYGYGVPEPIVPQPARSHVSIGLGHIDIQVPGFSYQARRSVGAIPTVYPTPQPALQGSVSMDHPAARLAAALSARQDGQVWLEYLQPERVAMTDNPVELAELAQRYQGVIANPDLAWLSQMDGFSETVAWLSQGQPIEDHGDQPISATQVSPLQDSVLEDSVQSAPSNLNPGEPTLAPALPEKESEPEVDASALEKTKTFEALPAPSPEPTTSL